MPQLELWLDPHEPHSGAEKVFVSHAHSDHIAEHREVILSAPTSRFMQARLGGAPEERILSFGQPALFDTRGLRWQITLLPAGHIFGSAMGLIEAEGESLLYTGDFKLRRGLSAEPCEPRHADDPAEWLVSRVPTAVAWDGWKRIDRHEVERGGLQGRPRVKLVRLEEMARLALAETTP